MTRVLALAALALVLAVPGRAQDPASASIRSQSLMGEAPRGAEMAPPSRVFEIRDGALWLDGRRLPPEAIPQGVDLSGMIGYMELVGPVTPVIDVDGHFFVFENERLVPISSSSKAGSAVYIMGDAILVPSASPEARLDPVVNEAYRRQLSEADQALYAQMKRESELEREIIDLARHVRSLAPGREYDALAADLRQRLRTLFDLKQVIRADELDRAEAEIQDLKETLKARSAIGDEIVEHRLRELLGREAAEQ